MAITGGLSITGGMNLFMPNYIPPPPPPLTRLYSWGWNTFGALGHNDTVFRSSPVQVGTAATWSQVSTGSTTVATKTDGTLWTWGYNNNGTVGLGDNVNRSSPVQVGALTTWSQVSMGANSTMAITTN